VVIGVNTIFSLYYYLRVVRVMFLTTSEEPALSANPVGGAIAGACAVMLVFMLVYPQPLYRLTGDYGKIYLGEKSQITSTKLQTNSNEENSKSQTNSREAISHFEIRIRASILLEIGT